MGDLFDVIGAVIAFLFSFKFAAGLAVGAAFHRFFVRNAIKAYKGVKGRL